MFLFPAALELPRFRGQLSAFETETFLASPALECNRGVRGVSPRVPSGDRTREPFARALHFGTSVLGIAAPG